MEILGKWIDVTEVQSKGIELYEKNITPFLKKKGMFGFFFKKLYIFNL